MRYTIHCIDRGPVTVEIEAGSRQEAVQKILEGAGDTVGSNESTRVIDPNFAMGDCCPSCAIECEACTIERDGETANPDEHPHVCDDETSAGCDCDCHKSQCHVS